MRTVFHINGGSRVGSVGSQSISTAQSTPQSQVLASPPLSNLAAPITTPVSYSDHSMQLHSPIGMFNSVPRSCQKKLYSQLDESTRPTIIQHMNQTQQKNIIQSATSKMEVNAHSDGDSLLSPGAHTSHSSASFSGGNGNGNGNGGGATFIFPGGQPTSSMSLTQSQSLGAHISSSPLRPFRAHESSPSPFMPNGSPSPSLSSMALSQSPAVMREAHSQSQSPLFSPPLFTPDGVVIPSPPPGEKGATTAMPPQFTANIAQAQGDTRSISQPVAKKEPAGTTGTTSTATSPQETPLKESGSSTRESSRRTQPSSSEKAPPTTPKPHGGERHSTRISAAEKAKLEAKLETPSPVNSPPAASLSACKGCSCKKSRCLKLYCECFARQGFCNSDCKCTLCQNLPGEAHADERAKAVQATLDRDPHAFFRSQESMDAKDAKVHPKGCHCKKSACLKKYCECFQAGLQCTTACKCVECKNGRPHGEHGDDEEEEAPVIVVSKSGRKRPNGSGGSASTTVSGQKRKRPGKNSYVDSTSTDLKKDDALTSTYRKLINEGGDDGAPTIAQSRASQRERNASVRARESALDDGAEEEDLDGADGGEGEEQEDLDAMKDERASPVPKPTSRGSKPKSAGASSRPNNAMAHHRGSPLDPSALSPATSSSAASSTIAAANHHRTGASGSRTVALQPGLGAGIGGGRNSKTLVLGGVGGLSFQAQLAAHQSQMALEKGHNSMEDILETDSDFTSHAGDSLHEVPVGTSMLPSGALTTPVKHIPRPGGKSNGGGGGGGRPGALSALETLVEVASPSPRMQHNSFRHIITPHNGLLSPVSPMSNSLSMLPALSTPNSKPRHRALTFGNGSSASPLPPLFSPLRHSQAASPQVVSPYGHSHSVSPSPHGLSGQGSIMTHVLNQQHAASAASAQAMSNGGGSGHTYSYRLHHGHQSTGTQFVLNGNGNGHATSSYLSSVHADRNSPFVPLPSSNNSLSEQTHTLIVS